jgi:hypothetical protein
MLLVRGAPSRPEPKLSMSHVDRMLYGGVFSLVICFIALGLGYGWMKGMNYPFTLRQRKMWTYYLLFISAIPVLGELFLFFTFWAMPLKQSGAAAIFLLAMWMVVVFYIIRKMSRPGGRFSPDRA